MKKDLFTKWPPTLYTRAKTLLLLFPITQKVSSILFFFFSPLSPSFSLARTHNIIPSRRPPGGSEGFEKFPRATYPSLTPPPPHRHRHSTDFIVPRPPAALSHSLARTAQSSPVVCTNMAAAFEPSLYRRHRPCTRSLRRHAGPDRIGCLVPSDYQYRSAGPPPRAKPQHASGPVRFFSRLPAPAPRGARRGRGQCTAAGASARNEPPTSRVAPPANRRPYTIPLSRSNRSAPRGASHKHGSRGILKI